KAEKAKHERAPRETETQPRKPRGRARRFAPCTGAIRQKNAGPRKQPDEHQRNEIPDRTCALVLRGQISVQMLVDEKKACELGIGNRYRDEPGRRDREKDAQTCD